MKWYLIIKSSLPFLSLFCSLFLYSEAFAQKEPESHKVKGSILGVNGNAIIGATIVVKGTTIGTASDLEGIFKLTVPSKNDVLVVSFKGYQTKEVSIDGKSSFEVILLKESGIKTEKSGKAISGVFDKVEVMPRPKEGDDGWNEFLAKNMKYPANDRASDIEGTVIVGFEVHEDGSLQNFEILRGIGGESDEEVIRVMSAGPAWEPGMINGEAVKTRMSLPVRFILKKEDTITSVSQTFEQTVANQYGNNYLVVVGYQPRASLR